MICFIVLRSYLCFLFPVFHINYYIPDFMAKDFLLVLLRPCVPYSKLNELTDVCESCYENIDVGLADCNAAWTFR